MEVKRKKEAENAKATEEAQSAERESSWQWVPVAGSGDAFIKDPGSWVFHGRQPRFEGEHWLFVADRPVLSFVNEGQEVAERFGILPDGALRAAKDSKLAQGLLPAIRQSIAMVGKVALAEDEDGDPAYHLKNGEGYSSEYGRGSGARGQKEDHEIRMDRGAFGDPEGIWEKCNAGQKGHVWAVFVPSAWMNAKVTKEIIESHEPFWVYKGKKMPYLDEPKIEIEGRDGEWVFFGKEPKTYAHYQALPGIVQQFLASLVNDGERPELNLEGRDLDFDEPEEEITLSIKPKVKVGVEVGGDSDTERPAVDAASGKTEEGSDAGGSAPTLEAGVAAPKAPPKPVSRIGLFYVASELNARVGLGVDAAAQRMVTYLADFCEGSHAELWKKSNTGDWTLVVSSKPGSSQESAIQSQLKKMGTGATRSDQGLWLIPMGKGALVVQEKSKGGAGTLSPELAPVIADALSGLVRAIAA